ncbi:unnamed protein product [Phaedon cochleariae]|uniref:Gustatory receptor n=1 Tax=Phaedon cochleariae TaxID=80249 RepID=A0A9P0DR37_PHACE|nr:unnamed protein product [Phaedon cochleariae]
MASGSREHDRVRIFRKRIREHLPEFTAAGFFIITRTTIYNIIEVVVFLYIVVVQFHLTSHKQNISVAVGFNYVEYFSSINMARHGQTISFLEPLIARIAIVFCILPSYSFQQHNSTSKHILFNCYSFIFTATISVAVVYMFYLRVQWLYDAMHPVVIFLEIGRDSVGIVLILFSAYRSTIQKDKWYQLIGYFRQLESPKINRWISRSHTKSSIFSKPNCLFVINVLVFILLNVSKAAYLASIDYARYWYFYWFLNFVEHIELVHFHILYNLFLCVNYQMGILTEILSLKGDIQFLMEKIKDVHQLIDRILETMNDFFGWTVLLILTHRVLRILFALTMPMSPSPVFIGREIQEHTLFYHYNILVGLYSLSVWKRKEWQKLFVSFDQLESTENLNTKFQKEEHIFTNINIIFFFNTVLYTIVIGSSVFMEGEYFRIEMKYNWNYIVQAYTELLHIFLMYNLILAIKNKYECINGILETKINPLDLIHQIDIAENLYYIMDEIVALFNNLCGWSMLLVILHRVIIVLYALSAPLAPSYIVNGKTLTRSPDLLLINICFSLVSLVMVMICCIDVTKKEPVKLVKSSIILQKNLSIDSKEYARLELFKIRVTEILPIFTAAGFFQIERSTILSVISVITTYFIVVVQFYLSSR